MNKKEFLDRLDALLACLPADKREESKAFYAEAIDDRMEDGASEEEAVAAVGNPGDAAEAILDDLPAVPRAMAKTRRKSNALLWTLVIVGSIVWVPLLIAFAAVAFSVYIVIWALIAAIWLLAAGLLLAIPIAAVTAVWGTLAGNIPFAIAQAGAGLLCAGIGLFVAMGAQGATRQLARLSRLWAAKALSPFTKRPKDRERRGRNGRDASQQTPASESAA